MVAMVFTWQETQQQAEHVVVYRQFIEPVIKTIILSAIQCNLLSYI